MMSAKGKNDSEKKNRDDDAGADSVSTSISHEHWTNVGSRRWRRRGTNHPSAASVAAVTTALPRLAATPPPPTTPTSPPEQPPPPPLLGPPTVQPALYETASIATATSVAAPLLPPPMSAMPAGPTLRPGTSFTSGVNHRRRYSSTTRATSPRPLSTNTSSENWRRPSTSIRQSASNQDLVMRATKSSFTSTNTSGNGNTLVRRRPLTIEKSGGALTTPTVDLKHVRVVYESDDSCGSRRSSSSWSSSSASSASIRSLATANRFRSFHRHRRTSSSRAPVMRTPTGAGSWGASTGDGPTTTTTSTIPSTSGAAIVRKSSSTQRPHHPHVLDRYRVQFAERLSAKDQDASFSISSLSYSSSSTSTSSRSLTFKHTDRPRQDTRQTGTVAHNSNNAPHTQPDKKAERTRRLVNRADVDRWSLSEEDRTDLYRQLCTTAGTRYSCLKSSATNTAFTAASPVTVQKATGASNTTAINYVPNLDSAETWIRLETVYFQYIDRPIPSTVSSPSPMIANRDTRNNVSLVNFVSSLLNIPVTEVLPSYREFLQVRKQIPVAGSVLLTCQPMHVSSTTATTVATTTTTGSLNTTWQWFVLMVFPVRGRRWSFTKGHVWPNETLIHAAWAETLEEVGYDIPLACFENSAFLDVDRTAADASHVRLFLIPNVDFQFPFKVNCRGEIERIGWIPLSTEFPADDLSALALVVWPKLLEWTRSQKRSPLPISTLAGGDAASHRLTPTGMQSSTPTPPALSLHVDAPDRKTITTRTEPSSPVVPMTKVAPNETAATLVTARRDSPSHSSSNSTKASPSTKDSAVVVKAPSHRHQQKSRKEKTRAHASK